MKRKPQRHSVKEGNWRECPFCGHDILDYARCNHKLKLKELIEWHMSRYYQLHQEYMWLFEKVREKEINEFWKKRQYVTWQEIDPLAVLDDDPYFEKVFKPMVERWKKK